MSHPLREMARGQPCYLRLVGFCLSSTETVSLAHCRVVDTCGASMKPPDACGFPCCFRCHNVYDGREKQKVYSKVELQAEAHRAHCQWLTYLWNSDLLVVKRKVIR